MKQGFEKELQQFDRERVVPAWHGLFSRQQATLESLGVPTMFVTDSGPERDVRTYTSYWYIYEIAHFFYSRKASTASSTSFRRDYEYGALLSPSLDPSLVLECRASVAIIYHYGHLYAFVGL